MDINKKKSLDSRLLKLHNALKFYQYYQNKANNTLEADKKIINNGNINMSNDPYYHTQTLAKPQLWKYKAFMPSSTPNMDYLQ
jgi:hypothetical protein